MRCIRKTSSKNKKFNLISGLIPIKITVIINFNEFTKLLQ